MTRIELEQVLRRAHADTEPLVLVNVWDVASARAVEAAGSVAIATSSSSVAATSGYPDGQVIPWEDVLRVTRRIVAGVSVPVSVDVEAGYGATLDELFASIRAIVNTGAVGLNIEDFEIEAQQLYGIETQKQRLQTVRRAAEGAPLFINARTDVFFRGDRPHQEGLGEVLERAHAYKEAGADGVFVPGLVDLGLIETLCARSPLPINVLLSAPTLTIAALARVGVARISLGSISLMTCMEHLRAYTRQILTRQ